MGVFVNGWSLSAALGSEPLSVSLTLGGATHHPSAQGLVSFWWRWAVSVVVFSENRGACRMAWKWAAGAMVVVTIVAKWVLWWIGSREPRCSDMGQGVSADDRVDR